MKRLQYLYVIFTVLLFFSPSLTAESVTSEEQFAQQIATIVNFLKERSDYWTSQWQEGYSTLPRLIDRYGLKIGCEIGVAFGMHSHSILANSSVQFLFSIDPYRHFETGYNDSLNFDQLTHNILCQMVMARLAPFGHRSILLRMASEEAITLFADESLDFVYIDGNHTFPNVKFDIENWYTKVRPGGIVSGDDYTSCDSVQIIVNNLCSEKKLTLNLEGRNWWIQKPQ
jgi:hypothetical protein